ncbi:hypothetical protein K438DRAFT_1981993 [Mycena galopus ATCC 62051]|nr:hypothetical protein K438DRAFT_1981993 [Mycena galopus ATCC 62051]
MVRALQVLGRGLPWSMANEDLVELFEKTGQVELAEILFDGACSKGCSSISPAAVGLSKFSPSSDYFLRQIKSFLRISSTQATVNSWHGYRKNLPNERKTGFWINYVIAILNWEFCTLGSLLDLANLTMDYSIAPTDIWIDPTPTRLP